MSKDKDIPLMEISYSDEKPKYIYMNVKKLK